MQKFGERKVTVYFFTAKVVSETKKGWRLVEFGNC